MNVKKLFLCIFVLGIITCNNAPNKGDLLIDIYFDKIIQDLNPVTYEVKGRKNPSNKFNYTIKDEIINIYDLNPGTWNVNVIGYDVNNVIVGIGNEKVDVYKETNTKINIKLLPVQ